MNRLLLAVIFLLIHNTLLGYEKVTIKDGLESEIIGRKVYFLEDKEGTLTFNDVKNSKDFILSDKDVLNFQVTTSSIWLKVIIENKDVPNNKDYFLEIAQPLLDVADFYYPDLDGNYEVEEGGMRFPFGHRRFTQGADFLYALDVNPGEQKTYYFRIQSKVQLLLPIKVLKSAAFYNNTMNTNIWFGIYCGIIFVMFMYNLFLYISVRDKSYLYYVLHTLFVGITQASLTGYTYKYLWPDSPWFGTYAVFLFTSLVSIVGVQFLMEFLLIKKRAPRIFLALRVFQLIYITFAIVSLFGYHAAVFGAILTTQSIIVIFILSLSLYFYKKGYAEAKYYLIGWAAFLLSIIIYVTKDFGLLPYNNFTAYSLWLGSVIEITLLSFALADKINILRRDKEESQRQTLAATQENARIVREQNILLETKVTERTSELSKANLELSNALKELKEAEAQLVESEKMASLGQLTAGIAHEINNPINFVTSNVNPLKRDVGILTNIVNQTEAICMMDISPEEKKQKVISLKQDSDYDYLCKEIEYLLNGIGEGATRTAEIVKGLRVFSRLDEDDLKLANIHDGLDSTLVILNHQLGDHIKVTKNYAELPLIECYPGKLNQVFLNIMTNAIHAINLRWNKQIGGELTVATRSDDNNAYISIQDNGIGMDEATQKKIFEPFFTTKEVGEGTGLGMSIAYNTIKKHNGYIELESTPGVGTTFTLVIPLVHVISKEVNAETTA